MRVPAEGAEPPGLRGVALRLGAALARVPLGIAWLPAALWMALIWRLSGMPSREGDLLARVASFWVNLAHAGAFGLLALWYLLLLPRAGRWVRLGRREVALVLAGVLCFAFLDEWHQSRTPGRHPTVLDVLTDLVGAVCVLWIAWYAPREQATERGLYARVAVCLALCILSAALATAVARVRPEPLWF